MPEHKHLRVLLAVENPAACEMLCAYLRAAKNVAQSPRAHASGEGLKQMLRNTQPDLLLLEMVSWENPLPDLLREFPDLMVVVLGPSSPEIAFEAAKSGATELLTLPLQYASFTPRLDAILQELTARNIGMTENGESIPAVSTPAKANHTPGDSSHADPAHASVPNLFSSSPRMQEIRDTINKVATTNATVLIRGESGVGKEIAARMIFARSLRGLKPFVKVNCAAIPSDLLESELFGYEAGAFTGAHRAKPGKFELAHSGTLFLDEIGEMHPALQAKLLHVLQDGVFARLGAKKDMAVDVRVLCATNKMLEQRVADGLFREDLYYRINVVTVHIPPLRERRDEVPLLIDYFLTKYAAAYDRRVVPFSEEDLQSLVGYSWPGNVRELENLCKRYVIVGGAARIVRELTLNGKDRLAGASPNGAGMADRMGHANGNGHMPDAELAIRSSSGSASEMFLLEIGRRAAWQAEKLAIQEMLTETRWNRREAARRLNVSYKALLNKIRVIEGEVEQTSSQ